MMKSSMKYMLSLIVFGAMGCSQEVQFNDPNLEAAVREAIGKPDGVITMPDLQGITKLEAPDNNISDITGIERCVNLESLMPCPTGTLISFFAQTIRVGISMVQRSSVKFSRAGMLSNLAEAGP